MSVASPVSFTLINQRIAGIKYSPAENSAVALLIGVIQLIRTTGSPID